MFHSLSAVDMFQSFQLLTFSGPFHTAEKGLSCNLKLCYSFLKLVQQPAAIRPDIMYELWAQPSKTNAELVMYSTFALFSLIVKSSLSPHCQGQAKAEGAWQ